MKKSILVITDSLGLPRAGEVHIKNTWIELLKDKVDFKIYDICKYGLDSNELLELMPTIRECYDIEKIVLQIGIVDCYPRALTRNELKVISRIPFVSSFLKFIIQKNREQILNLRNIQYTALEQFKSNLIDFKGSLDVEILSIPILHGTKSYNLKSKLIQTNICSYNSVLSDIFLENFLSSIFNDVGDKIEYYSDDGYHLSELGNKKVAEIIFDHI